MSKNELKVDLSTYKNYLSRKNQIARFIWSVVWGIFARPIPRSLFNSWKLLLLRIFGAKVHKKSVVYSSAKIFMPWNLEMEEYACLGPEVDCYNVGLVKIGKHTTVSQKSYLCTATHDIEKSNNPLVIKSIIIEDQAWIAADVFVGPGVTIGQGAVVGARAAVFKDVEPWTIVGGNPAKFIKNREIKN
ncbi:Acetyltransferase [Ignavibacterium album JCM 16511]|uniref:Acetyltransferase n=1 Tax=Ignavibacterium album (strain DSM 19864 / JCM 16511 / NBRC 101810 / Mat9-16) TaxID=945713 RepID=I0AJG6_IGNAJ|nr:transferase [Ignavibacterium album]AFH49123.1 Acetyltransferase [Ignavibacterium album JCM 16511]